MKPMIHDGGVVVSILETGPKHRDDHALEVDRHAVQNHPSAQPGEPQGLGSFAFRIALHTVLCDATQDFLCCPIPE